MWPSGASAECEEGPFGMICNFLSLLGQSHIVPKQYSLTMPYTYPVAEAQAELPADLEAMTALRRAREVFAQSVRELPE